MTVNEILIDFGRTIVKELKDNLKNHSNYGGSINASGALQDSIKFTTKVMGSEFTFQLTMKDYYEWVDEGRKKTKGGGDGSLYKNILKWIQTKPGLISKIGTKGKSNRAGISGLQSVNIQKAKSLAFLITRKIHREGTKATHFFSDVYNDEALLKLKRRLQTELQKEVKIELTRVK